MFAPTVIFMLKEVQFRPCHASYCSLYSRIIKFDQHQKNFSCFLTLHSRAGIMSYLRVPNFELCPARLKCHKQSDFQMYNTLLRASFVKWGRCTSPRISKFSSKSSWKCRSKQPIGNNNTDQQHVKSLKETKRRVAKKMEELRENVVTVPNALCIARMAVSPVLGYLVIQEFYTTSLGIFILAGVTDVADGYIARTFPSQQSMIGSFLDPVADKLLVATLFLSLTANGIIPVPLTSLIIFRDVCLITAGFYIRYISLPEPKTLGRYFDVSFATARLSPTYISKANTLVQLTLVAFSLAAPVFGFVDHLFLKILWYVTGTTTILSAASYVYYRNTYKFLMRKNKVRK